MNITTYFQGNTGAVQFFKDDVPLDLALLDFKENKEDNIADAL